MRPVVRVQHGDLGVGRPELLDDRPDRRHRAFRIVYRKQDSHTRLLTSRYQDPILVYGVRRRIPGSRVEWVLRLSRWEALLERFSNGPGR